MTQKYIFYILNSLLVENDQDLFIRYCFILRKIVGILLLEENSYSRIIGCCKHSRPLGKRGFKLFKVYNYFILPMKNMLNIISCIMLVFF